MSDKIWSYKYLNYAIDRLRMQNIAPDIPYYYIDEKHRHYHTWDHIEDLLWQAEERGVINDDALFLAIVFHDAIYNPKKNDNEEQSAKLFKKYFKGNKNIKDEVVKLILETKTHKPTSPLSNILCEMDMSILDSDLPTLLDYENKIFKEYQFVDWKIYQAERVKFLEGCQKTKWRDNIDTLIKIIKNKVPQIGIYAGSFNPFTVGHLNILEKAERVFDKVIIARGKNPDKKASIFPIPDAISFRQNVSYEGLLTDFIKTLGYDVTLVRGLRNSSDAQYELTQYRYLQDLDKNIKVVSFFCDKDYEHVSSSAVRALVSLNDPKKKYKLESPYIL